MSKKFYRIDLRWITNCNFLIEMVRYIFEVNNLHVRTAAAAGLPFNQTRRAGTAKQTLKKIDKGSFINDVTRNKKNNIQWDPNSRHVQYSNGPVSKCHLKTGRFDQNGYHFGWFFIWIMDGNLSGFHISSFLITSSV